MATDVVWMTAAAHERLQAELASLEIAGRELTTADKSRLAELRELLRRAQVSTMPDDGLVEPGMRVTVRFDDGDTTEFVLGDRAMLALDPSIGLPVYSPTSPLGSAINGLFPGDTATMETPRGPRTLTVVEAHPAT